MLVHDQTGLERRPVTQQLTPEAEHLGVDEGGRGGQLGIGSLGSTVARDGGGIRGLDGIAEHCVHANAARPSRQLDRGPASASRRTGSALPQPSPERSQGGHVREHGLELALPGSFGREDLCLVPGAVDRHRLAGHGHSGMLPCLRFGVGSRFARCISSARIR